MEAQFMELMLCFVYEVQNYTQNYLLQVVIIVTIQAVFSGISKDLIMLSHMFKKQHKKAQSTCLLGVAEIRAVLCADTVCWREQKLALKGVLLQNLFFPSFLPAFLQLVCQCVAQSILFVSPSSFPWRCCKSVTSVLQKC